LVHTTKGGGAYAIAVQIAVVVKFEVLLLKHVVFVALTWLPRGGID